MKRKRREKTWNYITSQAQKGFRGYPIATVAYYGPDDKFASKAVVGIIQNENDKNPLLGKWFSQEKDVRQDRDINEQIADFIKQNGAKSVGLTDRIIGCPHEEGIDYPTGASCPLCPFWAGRNRWTGELLEKIDQTFEQNEEVLVAAWYREDQWDLLLNAAVDKEALGETYQDWEVNFNQLLRKLRDSGHKVSSIEVDVKELIEWCKQKNLPLNGAARAQYAALKGNT